MFLSGCTTLSSDNWWHTDLPVETSNKQDGAYRQAPVTQRTDNKVSVKRQSKVTRAQAVTANIIREGQMALSENRLLTPEGDNANLYFQIALGRDPGNYDATIGIAAIVDKYLAWAIQSANAADFKSAEQFIERAKRVNPRDPNIQEIEVRVEQKQVVDDHASQADQQFASEDIFHLPDDLFQLSEEKILSHIQPIIDRVEKTQGSIEIHWPRDKEGRLLYQIINSRTPNFRVRAMTFLSSEHTVEVLVN